jgi:nitroreductase
MSEDSPLLDRLLQAQASPPSGAERERMLRTLLHRYSLSPKHLGPPGPSHEELQVMTLAALRAPDHEKLIPFRFVVIRGEGLQRLADLYVQYGRRRGKTGRELEQERERALNTPVVIGVVARIDPHHPEVPVHDQWACVGGAITNALNALHIMGYGAKMVAGARALDPGIVAAHCREGEVLAGWICTGTPVDAAQERGDIDPDRILTRF